MFRQMVRAFEVGGEDGLCLCHGTHLIGACPVAFRKVKAKVGDDIVAVTRVVLATTDKHVVPLDLMVGEVEVQLAVQTEVEVMDGIETFLDGGDIFRLLAVGHHLFIKVALCAAVGVLQIGSQEHAEPFLPETVADGEAGIDVRHRQAVTGDLCTAVLEIVSGSVVATAIALVRCFFGDLAALGTEIIVVDGAERSGILVALPKEVAGADGGIGLEPELARSVFHVHVDDTAGSIALHVSGQ